MLPASSAFSPRHPHMVEARRGAGRVNALDAARGVLLILSVSAEAVLSPRPNAFVHTEWVGLHYYDWIFPLFVSLSGCGMAFLFRSKSSWRRNIRRVAVLIVAGLAYNYVVEPNRGWAELRYTGVLQLYAGLVLLVGVLHFVLRRTWHWAGFTIALSCLMTTYWLAVSRHCPGAIPQPTCNTTLAVEGSFFDISHMYRKGARGFEPEGLLGIFGALTTASAGVTAGHLLKSKSTPIDKARHVLTWSACSAVVGMILWLAIPGLKWLWTPSYGLVTGSAGLILLAVWYWLIDAGPFRGRLLAWSKPLRALGRNSLLVYFGSHVAMMMMLRVGDPDLPHRIAGHLEWTGYPGAAWVVLVVSAWWLTAIALDRRQIYIRA